LKKGDRGILKSTSFEAIYEHGVPTMSWGVSISTATPTLDWRQIFQAVPEGLIIIGPDFDVLFVNSAFSVLSGVAEMQAIGRKCYDIFPGPLCHSPACPMAR
jgi:PAS domain-containing protein